MNFGAVPSCSPHRLCRGTRVHPRTHRQSHPAHLHVIRDNTIDDQPAAHVARHEEDHRLCVSGHMGGSGCPQLLRLFRPAEQAYGVLHRVYCVELLFEMARATVT